jgi:MarR-like DNA-binding transcriptional regulator SgrR of sgrS sRNA
MQYNQEPTLSTRANQQRRILIYTRDNPTMQLQRTQARALECLISTSAPLRDKSSTYALLSFVVAAATSSLLQTCTMYQCVSVSNEEGITFIYTNLSSDFSSRADFVDIMVAAGGINLHV